MKRIWLILYLVFLELKRCVFGIKYYAEVDVTDNCNLKCTHCYHFNGKSDFKPKEISMDVWEKRLTELHDKGIRILLLVGGEPALREDVLMLADKMFPFIHVITNGTIKISKKFDHRLFVSLEGCKEINDSIRGEGVYSKVLKNYSGDKRVILITTMNKHNYLELEHLIELAKENDFMGVVCNIFTPTHEKSSPLYLINDERKLIIEEIKRVKKKHPNHFLLTKPMIRWYEFPNHVGYCHWGDTALHFDISWKSRRCFSDADCSNCGCLMGAIQNHITLLKTPKEMFKLI